MLNVFNKKSNKDLFDLILSKINCLRNTDAGQEALVACIGACVISEFLNAQDIKIKLEDGLCSSFSILNEYELANIRTDNNLKIGIRAVVGDEYPQMCIPKEHFSKGMCSDIYVGVKINKNLDEIEITGFIKAEDVPRTKGTKYYYIVESAELNSINEIKEALESIDKQTKIFLASDHEKAAALFFPFIDKTISEEDRSYFLEHLSNCNECRKEFSRVCWLNNVFKKEQNNLLIDNDYTLRLFAGDPVLEGEETEIVLQEEESVFDITDSASEIIKDSENFTDKIEIKSDEESSEQEIEISKKKKRTPRDWADELIGEQLTDSSEKENELTETNLSNETLGELQEDILTPIEDESLDITEHENFIENKLSEQEFFSEENLKQKEEIASPDILSKEEDFSFDNKDETKKEVKREELDSPDILDVSLDNKDERKEDQNSSETEIENILDHLDDVEIIQGEDDINNILSFFDPTYDHLQHKTDDSNIEKEKTKQEQSEPIFIQPSENEGAAKNTQPLKDDDVLYTPSDIDNLVTANIDDPDFDIILHEEGHSREIERINSSVEILRQEDLLSMFDSPESEYNTLSKENKINLKELLGKIIKDKSMLAFTVGITLTTTVMFVYLGQINQQVEIANKPETEITKPIVENKRAEKNTLQSQNEVKAKAATVGIAEKRTRTPIKSYSREIEKVVKYEKKIKLPDSDINENSNVELNANSSISEEKQESKILKFNIKNISWELSPEIARNSEIKKYFVEISDLIENTLNEKFDDLLELGLERTKLNIELELSNKGTILKDEISLSSGSESFDRACLNVLYEAIKDNKIPQINKDTIELKLLIKF